MRPGLLLGGTLLLCAVSFDVVEFVAADIRS
jgi:hypothetical protein